MTMKPAINFMHNFVLKDLSKRAVALLLLALYFDAPLELNLY